MKKKYINIVSLLVLLLVFSVSSVSLAAPNPDDAKKLVKDTAGQLLSEIKAKKKAIDKKPNLGYQIVSKRLVPHFDFDRMSAQVLGAHWKKASAGQKSRFKKEFEKLLVRTYTKAMVDNADETMEFLSNKKYSKPQITAVRTEIVLKSGPPLPIDYVMYHSKGEWKVVDVRIDELSMVKNFKSSFSSEIRKVGLKKLISNLASKNKQEMGG